MSLGTVSAHKQLQTIGIVRARSQSSVFQPKQTIDSYTIAGARIIQTTGKAFATNQNNLVLAVPGVTLSNAGNPTIRGGLRTEVGYQLDGIPFTEPFFSQNASNGTFNGLGSLQVVEGAGDATQSDVGGGVVNIVPQRGTNPPFGAVDAEIGGPNFSHQFGINYGFATANGRISDYFSYIGQRNVPYLGQRGLATAAYNNFYGVSYNSSDDFLNNFVVKFGHDNNQSLQVLYENRRLDQYGNAGGIVNSGPFATSFYPNDPANPFNQNNPATGPFALQNYNNLVGLTPGLPQNLSAAVTGPELALFNPTRFLKFEYDYNVTPNTLLQARYYNWETLQGNQDLTGFTGNTPASLGLGSYPVWSQTGGQRTGAIVDITQQIGSRSTTTISGNYDDSHIVWDEFDPNAEVFELALSDLFGRAGPAYSDFLPGGYLSSFFPGGVPRIPVSGINYNGALFHSYGIGVREQYA
ncbi:MAG: hypothetical protein ACRD1G_20270, partial [Acidimicrobiales bacterium]